MWCGTGRLTRCWFSTFWWVTWSECRWEQRARNDRSRARPLFHCRSRRLAACSAWPIYAASCSCKGCPCLRQRPTMQPIPCWCPFSNRNPDKCKLKWLDLPFWVYAVGLDQCCHVVKRRVWFEPLGYQSIAGFYDGLEIGRWWSGMATQHGTFGEVFENVIGDRNVSQQHELFDQAVSVQHRFTDDVNRIVGFVTDLETNFWTGQRQSSANT